jgi:hypothetical protein
MAARVSSAGAHGCENRAAPYDGQVVNFLVHTHWFDSAVAGDQREVGKAIGSAMKDAAKGA